MAETIKADVVKEKNRIIDFLKNLGPSVPNSLTKTLNIHSFLTAALLSELVNEKQIYASFLRVGGSPLYYLSGQEEKLENYVNFLNHKEREAFVLLKKAGILRESELDPAIRVAIKNVKDFAVPLKASKGNEEIMFWKYRFFSEADAKIKETLKEPEAEKEIAEKAEEKQEVKKVLIGEASGTTRADALRGKKKSEKTEGLLEKWATDNKVNVHEVLFAKGKDLRAKVTVKSEIGEIDFLLILKNKKSINESDLAMACQEGFSHKLPVIFLTSGKLSKQSQQYFDNMGKSIILRKL